MALTNRLSSINMTMPLYFD